MTKLERNKRISILYPIWMSGYILPDRGYLIFAKGSLYKFGREKHISLNFNESICRARAKSILEKMNDYISTVCIELDGKEAIYIPISNFNVQELSFGLSNYKSVNFCLLTSDSFEYEHEGEFMLRFDFKDNAKLTDIQSMKDCLKASVKNVHYISFDIPKE